MTERRNLLLIVSLGFLMCLPMIIFNRVPGNDAAGVYCPFIREIAEGNWDRSFIHLIPPLFTIFGGLIGRLGFDAFTAAKIASALFYCLTPLPVYGLIKRVFDGKTALIAAILPLFCSRIMQYAGDGLVTTTKMFFLLLTVYAVHSFMVKMSWRNALLAGFAIGCLSIVRGEGILFGGLGGLLMVVAAVRTRGKTLTLPKALLQTVIAAVIAFTIISPWMIYVYQKTGYLATDSKQASILMRLFGKQGRQKRKKSEGQKLNRGGAENRPAPETASIHRTKAVNSMAKEVGEGLYLQFLVFALPIIVMRIRRRKWRLPETYVLSWLVIHTLFFLLFGQLTHVVQKRYFIAAAPLYFGWTALCLRRLWDILQKRSWSKAVGHCLLALLISGLVWHGTQDARPDRSKEKQQWKGALLDAAKWVSTQGIELVPDHQKPLQRTKWAYRNGRKPVVMAVTGQVPFTAKSDWVYFPSRDVRLKGWDELRKQCKDNSVNFIVVDEAMLIIAPVLTEPTPLPPDFSIQYAKWKNIRHPVWLLGYNPNLKSQ